MSALAAVAQPDHDPQADWGLPGWVYHDAEFLAAEMARVFRPSWQLVCHLCDLPDAGDWMALDLPGHGLSDAWDAPSLGALADLLAEAIRPLAHPAPTVIGHGWSALIAPMVAARLGGRAEGEGAQLPHPADAPAHAVATPCFATPRRAGEHLVAGWAHARARLFFWPAHAASRANAIPFDPADVTPAALREAHLALAQARGAAHIRALLAGADWPALLAECPPARWGVADWARARVDIWKP